MSTDGRTAAPPPNEWMEKASWRLTLKSDHPASVNRPIGSTRHSGPWNPTGKRRVCRAKTLFFWSVCEHPRPNESRWKDSFKALCRLGLTKVPIWERPVPPAVDLPWRTRCASLGAWEGPFKSEKTFPLKVPVSYANALVPFLLSSRLHAEITTQPLLWFWRFGRLKRKMVVQTWQVECTPRLIFLFPLLVI